MTDDIFGKNALTESNRIVLDAAGRRGTPELTTSSEGSFSFSDSPSMETGMHVHFSQDPASVANGN
ncbi:MAG TPA: hypothetical protein VJ370_05860, partial [Streptosporangiaceae bacterium]|nr:hypothetical protein [Streptosporangiaceae bacterium]